jgi:hypothetical protein
MNDKFKQLALEAKMGTADFDAGSYYVATPDRMQLFAELIVRECMSIVKSNTYGPNGEYDYSYSDESAAADERAETIYKDISHRFGVEQ